MNWYKESQTESEKVLVLMRGVPGAGKSTLARELGQGGVVYSTDDFFNQTGEYLFDAKKLGEAHKWNTARVEKALQEGISPVVIDNTNVQSWEMREGVKLAQQYGYRVEFAQPKWHPDLYTPEGKWNFEFLKGRNTHGVGDDILKKKIDQFDYNPTTESVLQSKAPWEK